MRSKRVVNTVLLLIAVIVMLYVIYGVYAHITQGRPMSRLPAYYLLLTVPVGIWRIASIRRASGSSPEERRNFNKVLLRSVLIAILIVSLVVIATALYAINRDSR